MLIKQEIWHRDVGQIEMNWGRIILITGSPGTGGSGAGGSSLLEQELMVAAAKSAKGRSFKYLIVLPFVFLTRMLPLWQRVRLLQFHFMWISPLPADIQL